jgi:adenine deaminase
MNLGSVTEWIDEATRARAVRAAQGQAPFDVLIEGGTVVDVGCGDLWDADIGLVGPLIASVHPPATRTDSAARVDARGLYVSPGFMDLHVHFESSMLTPAEYAAAVCPRGTTTVFADPHELANAAGLDGVRYALAASRDLPVRFVIQAPSCVPPAPGLELSAADLEGPDIAEMLTWPGVEGVAEVMDMLGVLARSERMVEVVAAGLRAGKIVSGHASALRGARLQGYLCSGVTSDHEILTADDAMEKLRAGMTVELRSGMGESVGTVLGQMVRHLRELPAIPPHLVTATDDVFAAMLLEEGGIDHVLRILIAEGLDPVAAIRCATLNGAYRLQRSDLGLVGPGRRADLVLLSDLERLRAEQVFFAGHLVAAGGALVDARPPPAAPIPLSGTVRLDPLTPAEFVLRVGDTTGPARVRTLVGVRFPEPGVADVELVEGRLSLVPPGHLLQAVVHRYGRTPGVPQLGLLAGWGQWDGAIATTVSHDTHNLVVFGTDGADMALAANAVIAAGGGVAVAQHGVVLDCLDLPIAGILSPLPVAQLAARQRHLQASAVRVAEFSSRFRMPLFQVMVASLACQPGLHVTDLGVIDGSAGVFLESLAVGA